MTKEQLNQDFLSAVQAKLPYKNKTSLVNTFTDILNIEKEAAYRRIRGEVPFSFLEIATISNRIGISLDEVCSTLFPQMNLFYSEKMDVMDSNEKNYNYMNFSFRFFSSHPENIHSEMMESTSSIPLSLYQKYNQISRFYLLKYLYLSGNVNKMNGFSGIDLTDDFKENQKKYISSLKDIKEAYYIVDPLFIRYLVSDILYFYTIRLINKEEVEQLKNELLDLLKDMEVLSIDGMYNTTKNKIHIYISGISFNTEYSCVEIDNTHMSQITIFALNQMISFEISTYKRIRSWLYALLKTSTEISVSGERQRILFFEKQREIIETLYLLE